MNAVKLLKEIVPNITAEQIINGEDQASVETIIAYINKKYSGKVIFDKDHMLPFESFKKEIDNEAPSVVDLKDLDEETAGYAITFGC